jgi:predicted DNA-binding transcriptional regulator AlpA
VCNGINICPVPSELLTTKQAAAILGVNVSTIWRYATTGRLEPAHVLDSRAMLFYPSDVEELRRRRRKERVS